MRVGHRLEVVPGGAGTAYGLEEGPSLVKQIREQKAKENARQRRAARRAARRPKG